MDEQTDDGKVIPKCHLCLQQVAHKYLDLICYTFMHRHGGRISGAPAKLFSSLGKLASSNRFLYLFLQGAAELTNHLYLYLYRLNITFTVIQLFIDAKLIKLDKRQIIIVARFYINFLQAN